MEAHSLEKAEEDDPARQSSRPPSSSRRCCCLLLIFLLLGLVLLCAVAFFLVLRPKKPVFFLHSIQLESLKLNVSESKQIYLPSSMASLLFVTHNPNKIGIRYTSTELGVLYGGDPVGVIRVPTFYQPPCGRNVSVIMHVVFEQVNLTELIEGLHGGGGSSQGSHVEIRVVGCIGARSHVLNFHLPKIKVALDCIISADYGAITLNHGISFLKTRQALLLSSFPHLSQKCSLGLCI